MSTKRSRESVIEALVAAYRKQLEASLPDVPQTLDQIEEIAGKLGNGVSRTIGDELSQPSPSVPQPKSDCRCGQPARYKGKQPRQVVTLHGVVSVRRAVYPCGRCQQSFAPQDGILGLDSGQTTRAVRGHAAYLAALLPFAQAATTLEVLTSVVVSAASVERIACLVGKALKAEQDQQVKAHLSDRL